MNTIAIAVAVYLGLVVGVESLVGVMGHRHADRGVGPDEGWLLLATTQDDGTTEDVVVAGVESEGALYVAANHWPRGWYKRLQEHPDVEVTRNGETAPYRAVPVSGEERERIAREYRLPVVVRFLTGFPPRAFLRLEPRRGVRP